MPLESLTLGLSGKSSILEVSYFPPIELDAGGQYELGLVELLTFNSIPNIDRGNNKLYIAAARTTVNTAKTEYHEIVELPTGSYEIDDLDNAIKKRLIAEKKVEIIVKPNNNTLKSIIHCNYPIDFRPIDSIGSLLGFKPELLEANKYHESSIPVSILKVTTLRVECSITSGAYVNGERSHTIHEFFPAVPPGYKIIEIPRQIIYLPITVPSIDRIQLRLVDQDGHLVNFRGENISIRLHVRKIM